MDEPGSRDRNNAVAISLASCIRFALKVPGFTLFVPSALIVRMADVTRTSIALLIVASLGATAPVALAQDLPPLSTDQPPAVSAAKAPRAKGLRKKGAPAAPATKASSEAAEHAAAIARARQKFFANQPDSPSGPSGPESPVHLGGSGGLSPEMGFKF
jgi:hypothetical protein